MVDEGFLTEDQLLDALAEQNRSGTPLGKVLVDLGFVSPGAVANALAEQHGGLLRTEYGTSAGLREMAGRAPIRTEASQPTLPMPAAPAPQSPAPAPAPLGSGLRLAGTAADAPAEEASAPVEEAPAPAAPQPEPVPEPAPQPELVAELASEPEPEPAPEPAHAPEPQQAAPEPALPSAADARIQELESQLHAVLTERNSLAQSFSELQARLSDAAQAHEAGVNAEVQERVGSLESQLQAAAVNREELERAQQQAAARMAELDNELQTMRTVAAGRDAALEKAAALEAELEQLRAGGNEDSNAELQELAAQREAAEARAQALESDLAQLREHLDTALQSAAAEKDSESARAAQLEAELDELRGREAEDSSAQLEELSQQREAAEAHAHELEAELAALREQSAGQDEAVAQVSGLNEALQALTVERDSAVERAAALEPEVESLREQLREAIAQVPVDGPQADVADLRRQLGARERRLAESVGEIAKMNREHRALLQLVERQFQLEETTTSVPETRSEAAHVLFVPSATGYTLVEREGVAPEAGDIVEVDGGRYVVRRHGPSPLPGPRRRCAYLERA
jgi:predicted  nucleic acid-binding Zn-ribbon protein